MCEASGLTGPPVDCHSDIQDVLDLAEEVIKILVAHLVRQIADEQGLCGGIDEFVVVGG